MMLRVYAHFIELVTQYPVRLWNISTKTIASKRQKRKRKNTNVVVTKSESSAKAYEERN